MKKHLPHIILLTIFTLLQCNSALAISDKKPIIVIAADRWCPINCAPSDKKEGVGIDLARAIFEPLGYRVNYRIMPWDKALEAVRRGEIHAVIGASRSDDKTLIFPSQEIYSTRDDFYIQKGVSWSFRTTQDLRKKKLGVIKDYGYGDAVKDYISANVKVHDAIQEAEGDNALSVNIHKLLRKQIDVIVESKPVMEYMLSTMSLSDQIVWAGSTQTDANSMVFLAFSPALPESRALAKAYDDGIKRLQAAGTLSGFYARYGLRL